MRRAVLAGVIGFGVLVGFGAAAMFDRVAALNTAGIYAELFRSECLPRVAARATGQDAFATLAKDHEQNLYHHASGLRVTQTRDRCEVSDDGRLMPPYFRNDATNLIEELIANELPELTHPGDDLGWDYMFSRVLQPPSAGSGNWGILVSRIEADSGDALQITRTTLVLPRD